MNLSTGEVLTPPNQGIKTHSLTETHLKAVEKMVQCQGIAEVCFMGCHGDLLRDEIDDACPAGVGNESDDEEDEEETEEPEEEPMMSIDENEEEEARDALIGDPSPNAVNNTKTDDKDDDEIEETTNEIEQEANDKPEETEVTEPEPEVVQEPARQEPERQTFRTRSGTIYGRSHQTNHKEKKVKFAG